MAEKNFNNAERNDDSDSPVVKMEGIKPTAKRFGISEHYIRQLVKKGKVKAVKVSDSSNAKILVNIQSVNDYFNSSYIGNEELKCNDDDGIMPIPVNL